MSAPVVLWLEDEAVADFDVLVYGADRQDVKKLTKMRAKYGRFFPNAGIYGHARINTGDFSILTRAYFTLKVSFNNKT